MRVGTVNTQQRHCPRGDAEITVQTLGRCHAQFGDIQFRCQCLQVDTDLRADADEKVTAALPSRRKRFLVCYTGQGRYLCLCLLVGVHRWVLDPFTWHGPVVQQSIKFCLVHSTFSATIRIVCPWSTRAPQACEMTMPSTPATHS